MAPPPRTTPPTPGRPAPIEAPAARATSSQWRSWRRRRLGLVFPPLELPEGLDEPDEPADQAEHGTGQQCPGRRAEPPVDEPADEGASGDRSREVDAERRVPPGPDERIGPLHL